MAEADWVWRIVTVDGSAYDLEYSISHKIGEEMAWFRQRSGVWVTERIYVPWHSILRIEIVQGPPME